jgi:hypothetical protein
VEHKALTKLLHLTLFLARAITSCHLFPWSRASSSTGWQIYHTTSTPERKRTTSGLLCVSKSKSNLQLQNEASLFVLVTSADSELWYHHTSETCQSPDVYTNKRSVPLSLSVHYFFRGLSNAQTTQHGWPCWMFLVTDASKQAVINLMYLKSIYFARALWVVTATVGVMNKRRTCRPRNGVRFQAQSVQQSYSVCQWGLCELTSIEDKKMIAWRYNPPPPPAICSFMARTDWYLFYLQES